MFPIDPKDKIILHFKCRKGFDAFFEKESNIVGTKIKCGLEERFWYNLYS